MKWKVRSGPEQLLSRPTQIETEELVSVNRSQPECRGNHAARQRFQRDCRERRRWSPRQARRPRASKAAVEGSGSNVTRVELSEGIQELPPSTESSVKTSKKLS